MLRVYWAFCLMFLALNGGYAYATGGFSWSASWAWHQDWLDVAWSGASDTESISVDVVTLSYLGEAGKVTKRYRSQPSGQFRVGEYGNQFYCASEVTVTLTRGWQVYEVLLPRTDDYPPRDPERCE